MRTLVFGLVALCALPARAEMSAAELLTMCDESRPGEDEIDRSFREATCLFYLKGAVDAISMQAQLNKNTSLVCLPEGGVTLVEVRDGLRLWLRKRQRSEEHFSSSSARGEMFLALANTYPCRDPENAAVRVAAVVCGDDGECLPLAKFPATRLCEEVVAVSFPGARCVGPGEELEEARVRRAQAVRVKAGATGTLTLETVPWTAVYLGEKKLGETPLMSVPVPAGDLEFTLVNEKAGIRERFFLEVESGKAYRRKLKLN